MVRPWFWLVRCLLFGSFFLDPSYCASSTPYLIEVCLVVLFSDGFLAILISWVRCLSVWTSSDLTSGLAVFPARAMPPVGRFMPSPSSFVSSPIYILGVGRVFLSDDGLLAEFPCLISRDRWGALSWVFSSCTFIGVATLLSPDAVSDAPTGAGTRS